MSPNWLVCLVCFILVIMTPDPVTSQSGGVEILRLVRGALCGVSSGAFVAMSCAADETTPCRVIAYKLSLLCRTFPCINYGTVSGRTCESLPLGCPPWNIRPFGLCEPLKVCCAPRLSPQDISSSLAGFVKSKFSNAKRNFSPRKSTLALSKILSAAKGNKENLISVPVEPAQNEAPAYMNATSVIIPSTPMEYMKDWPDSQDDPDVMDKTIKQQYEKLVKEINAINTQENGKGSGLPVKIPGFEEFRAIALGEKPAQQ